MPVTRALRSALAATWSACTSIDLEDCALVIGYGLLSVGCWQVYPPLGYIVPGSLIVLPRLVLTLLKSRVPKVPRERQRWAS
jgi:hypothetical protein